MTSTLLVLSTLIAIVVAVRRSISTARLVGPIVAAFMAVASDWTGSRTPLICAGILAISLVPLSGTDKHLTSVGVDRKRRRIFPWVLPYEAVLFFFYHMGRANLGVNYDKWSVMAAAPLAVAVGFRLSTSPRFTMEFVVAVTRILFILAVSGLVELARNRLLFRHLLVIDTRNGEVRAQSLFAHPLVFATACACALPFVSIVVGKGRVDSKWVRLVYFVVLSSAAYSSQSRGVLILIVVIWAIYAVIRYSFEGGHVAKALIVPAFSILLIGVAVWTVILVYGIREPSQTIEISSPNNVTASAQYRGALYRLIPEALHEQPLGSGLGQFPPGRYAIDSQFGALDISRSIDSEPVLDVLKFGWIGLAAFLLSIYFTFRGLIRALASGPEFSVRVSLSLLTLLGAGIFLAIHPWIYFVIFAGILSGISSSATRNQKNATSGPDRDCHRETVGQGKIRVQ